MPSPVLFLEQQAHRAGAQRVLGEVLRAIEPEYLPIVGFPDDGPFVAEIRRRGIETFVYPLGRYRTGRKSFADMMNLPLRSVYCGLRLAGIIRQRRIRLVYINGPRCLIAGALAARLTGRPSVFHLHLTLTRKEDIFLVARAAKYLTKIVSCSKTTAAALLAGHPELNNVLQVIYNPVRRSTPCVPFSSAAGGLHAHRSKAKGLVVGVVGRITPQKGQHVVLEAASELTRRGRNVSIVFVGAPDPHNPEDNSYLSFLKSFVKGSGLEGQISWAGYQEDPNPFYAGCDVIVIPSTVSEGLPMVALEAMQLGIPVIGSSVGGILEIVREGVNGFLFPPKNAAALADCVQRVLDDSELLGQLKAEALATLDGRFSIENFRGAIRRVIAECARD
jgi:glycosyltransferase involved in cell wall biosynthesis